VSGPGGRRVRLAGGLLVLAIAAAGALAWMTARQHQGYERTDNAYVHADVSVVSPRVEGYVEAVLVDDHARVAAGDPLVRIVDDRLRNRVARRRAEVTRREAALASHAARRDAQSAEVAVAQAAVATAQAELDRARLDLERSSKLVRQGWTSQQIHDDNRARMRIARATLEEARTRAAAAERRLAVIDSELAALEAELEEARAELRLAGIALADAVVRAPVAGIVGNREVQPGEYVRAGTHLLSIVPTTGMWVEANYKETQIDTMRAGQRAFFTVDALPGTIFCGTLQTLSPASGAEFALLPPDNATGNFTKVVRRIPVRIAIPDSHPRRAELRAGMSVIVTVRTARAQRRNPHSDLDQRLLARLGASREGILHALGLWQPAPCD